MATPTPQQLVDQYKVSGNLTPGQITGNTGNPPISAETVPVSNASASQSSSTITSDTTKQQPQIDVSAPSEAYNSASIASTANAAAVSGAADAKITNAKNELDKYLASSAEAAKSSKTNDQNEILKQLGLYQQAQNDRITALQSPEFLTKQQAANDAYSALQQSKQAQANEIDAINKSNMTDAGRAAALQTVTNKYALQNANLSVTYDVANRDYVSAQNNINTVAQLKMDAIQPWINYYQSALTMDNADWTSAEKNIIEQKIAEYTDMQKTAGDNAKLIGQYQLDAAQNGAPTSIIQAMSQAKTPEEALTIGGQYIGLLDRQIKNAQLAKLNASDSSAPTVKSINGVDMQWNPNTQKWETIDSQGGGNAIQLAQAQDNISLITGLLGNSAISTTVGPNRTAREGYFIGIPGLFGLGKSPDRYLAEATGKTQNFISGVEQLTSQLSLDSLIRAKAQGATFGALSEGELNILTRSASKIDSWAIKDKNGNVVGYNVSENDFKRELDRINNLAKIDFLKKGGNPEDAGIQILNDGRMASINSDGTVTYFN